MSLRQALGTPVSREQLLADVCNALEDIMALPFSKARLHHNPAPPTRCSCSSATRPHTCSPAARSACISRRARWALLHPRHSACKLQVHDERDYDAVVKHIAADGRLVVANMATGAVEMLSGHEVSIGVAS